MRILHVLRTLDPASGGPPMVVTRLASAQAGLGHDVGILAHLAPGTEADIAASVDGVPGFDRVEVVHVPAPGRAERLLARGAARRLAERLPRTDLVYIHNLWAPIALMAGNQAARRGVPYVVVPHGVLDPWSMRQNRLKKRLALTLAFKRLLDRALFLHMLNADERDLVRPLDLRRPMEVIPNGVFLEELDPLPERGAFAAAHPELEGAPYVLFLSRLHYKKGLDYLADAFARFAGSDGSARLVVAGPDGGARAAFEERIAGAGLAGRVHLTGPIYGDEKMAALVGARCFCLPSRQEGFSIAITEALACGIPVVISTSCHFPEVAEAGAGVVTPLDADAVADGLRRVMSDDAEHARMSAAGRELVRARFTWPRIAEQTIDAYARHTASA